MPRMVVGSPVSGGGHAMVARLVEKGFSKADCEAAVARNPDADEAALVDDLMYAQPQAHVLQDPVSADTGGSALAALQNELLSLTEQQLIGRAMTQGINMVAIQACQNEDDAKRALVGLILQPPPKPHPQPQPEPEPEPEPELEPSSANPLGEQPLPPEGDTEEGEPPEAAAAEDLTPRRRWLCLGPCADRSELEEYSHKLEQDLRRHTEEALEKDAAHKAQLRRHREEALEKDAAHQAELRQKDAAHMAELRRHKEEADLRIHREEMVLKFCREGSVENDTIARQKLEQANWDLQQAMLLYNSPPEPDSLVRSQSLAGQS